MMTKHMTDYTTNACGKYNGIPLNRSNMSRILSSDEEKILADTLPEINIAPKNGWLEYYFPIGEAYFQVRTVSFREGTS